MRLICPLGRGNVPRRYSSCPRVYSCRGGILKNRIELQVWVVQNKSATETTVGPYGSVIVPGVLLMTGRVRSLVGEKSDPSQCPFMDRRNTRRWLRVSN